MEPVEFRKIYERYASDVMRFALYLSGSRAVRGELRVRPALEGAVMLNPDVEAAALKRTRDLVKGNAWLRGLRLAALALTALAVVHLVRDTDWTVDETRVFAFDAIGAAMAWILYATLLRWYRQRALRA